MDKNKLVNMPSSVLSTYKFEKTSPATRRNKNDASESSCGERFSPVVSQLNGRAQTPPGARRFTPGCAQPVIAANICSKQSRFRPAPDGHSVTSPTPKKKWYNKSSNNITNESNRHAVPPQLRRDGRGMSPVPLFKRSSTSTSSLGSVTSTEESNDDEVSRFYIAPGRRTPLPAIEAKCKGHQRKISAGSSAAAYTSHSSSPPLPPKKSFSTSNISSKLHSPQPPRKPVKVKKAVMTPPLTRRDHLPPPLVLTPPRDSSIQSPGPPRRHAPLPPVGETASPSSKRLSPLPLPPRTSCQDPASPKLPPKPAHLKSSPASPRRSPVPFQFSYTPPASPGAFSSQGDSSPPIVPVREVKLSRAPLPPPPVTSQPVRSICRAPLPPPKADNLRSVSPTVIRHEDNNESRPVSGRKDTHAKSRHHRHHHAKQEQRERQSSKQNKYSQKVSEKKKKEEEEDESCCGACLRDCVADLPEYLLDFFC